MGGQRKTGPRLPLFDLLGNPIISHPELVEGSKGSAYSLDKNRLNSYIYSGSGGTIYILEGLWLS